MAVGPFRALAAVHLRSTWNRLVKQMGNGGIIAFVLVLVVLTLTSVLPLLGALGALGWLGASQLEGPEGGRVVIIGALFFSGLTFFAGVVGGISSGSRQLPWETLRGFPVQDGTLFAAELFAGAGEAITVVELLALLSACLGATLGAPFAGPLFLLLFVTHALMLLALQQLAGSLAQRVSRRLRMMLVLLPIAALAIPSLMPLVIERTTRASFQAWTDRLGAFVGWLPARALLEAARGLVQGDVTLTQLTLAVVVPLAVTALVIFVAFQAVSRERPLTLDTDRGPAAKLWSFRSQTWGVARLQWESLSQSLPGRFGLVMPLLTIVLIRGPLAVAFANGAWTAPVAFGYAALASTNLLFNQFGLDRHGVKVLFLLPVQPDALLKGKLVGFAAWQAVQALMLAGLLVLTGHHDVLELAIGLLLYVGIFLILAMVGQFASIWQPRPLKKNGLRASQPPLTVVLMIFGTLCTAGALLYGITFAVRVFLPGWELPVLLVVITVLGALLFPVLAFNTLFLERNREKLVEVLGSAG